MLRRRFPSDGLSSYNQSMSDILYFWSSKSGYSFSAFSGDHLRLIDNAAFMEDAFHGIWQADCTSIIEVLHKGVSNHIPIRDKSTIMLVHIIGIGHSLVFYSSGESIVLPVVVCENECIIDLDRAPLPIDLNPDTFTVRIHDKAAFILGSNPEPIPGLEGREAFLSILDSINPVTRAQSVLTDLFRFMPDAGHTVDLEQICFFLKALCPESRFPPVALWEVEDAHDLLLDSYVHKLTLDEQDYAVMLDISGKDAFLSISSFREVRERAIGAADLIADRQLQRKREREEDDALKAAFYAASSPPCVTIIEDIPREVVTDDDKPHPYDVANRWNELTKPQPLLGRDAMISDASGEMEIIATLRRKAPWMEAAIHEIEDQLLLSRHAGRKWLHFSPILLVGPPGSGKSHFARMLAMASGVPYAWQSLAGVTDNRNLEGTARGWSNSLPCWPLTVMHRKRTANPILFVDEIDKVGDPRNGDPRETLLSMIEEQESRFYFDRCLQANADLSHISWMFAANEVQLVSPILRSRMEVVRVDVPGPEYFPIILENVLEDIAGRWGFSRESLPDLPEIIVEGLSRDFAKSKSLRSVSKEIRKALGRQMRQFPREALNGSSGFFTDDEGPTFDVIP